MLTQTMRPIEEVAKELAAAHRAADPKTTLVKLFSSPQDDEIRLLEISTAVPAIGEVLPYRFAPHKASQIDHPSIVVLMNPADWEDVQKDALRLPAGWDASSARDI